MIRIALLAGFAAVALQAPALADEIARPLHARLIAAPTYAAFADASRLTVQPPAATVTIARPLHARLIAPPTYAAFADASRLVVPTEREFAMLPQE